MKNYKLFALLGFVLFSITSRAQLPSHTQISLTDYSNLKQQGLLNPTAKYQIGTPVVAINGVVQPPITPAAINTLQCQKLIPIDGTFSVVPFTNGVPPDYRNDDGSVLINLPFNFCFGTTPYTQIYINTNGNVSLGTGVSAFSPDIFPTPSFNMIAPFWGDVDTRNQQSGLVYYKITPTNIIIRWNEVGYYNSQFDKLNDFQLILTNGADPILPLGCNVAFSYGDMQWTTGSASGGTSGFGGTPATVGINNSQSSAFAQIGRFNANSTAYDGWAANNDGINWLDNKVFYFNTCNNITVAPNYTQLYNCDTTTVYVNTSYNITENFNMLGNLPNTINPTNTTTFSGGLVLTTNNGNPASVSGVLTPVLADTGYQNIVYTATLPNGVTNQVIKNYKVLNTPPPNELITANAITCLGDSITLTAAPGFDSYLWLPSNQTTQSIRVATSNTIQLIVNVGQQSQQTTNYTPIFYPVPTPSIAVINVNCETETAQLFTGLENQETAFWLPTNSTNTTINVAQGLYNLTVTNAFGCSSTLDTNITFTNVPNMAIVEESSDGFTSTFSVLGAPPNALYFWSFDNSLVPTSTDSMPIVTFPEEGSYLITAVITIPGTFCPDTIFTIINKLGCSTINLNASVSVSPTDVYIDNNTPVNFSISNITPDVASNQLVYDDGNFDFNVFTNITHTYTLPGIYSPQLVLYDENNICLEIKNFGTVNVYLGSSVNENFNPNNFVNIVPNPASGMAVLKFNLPTATSTKAFIYNSLGQVVDVINIKANTTQYPLNLSTYPKGLYYCSIVAEGKTLASQKLVVE